MSIQVGKKGKNATLLVMSIQVGKKRGQNGEITDASSAAGLSNMSIQGRKEKKNKRGKNGEITDASSAAGLSNMSIQGRKEKEK